MRQKLARQPFEVLRLLLERPGEIVTREELRQLIWPQDTFVDYDLALKKAINRIREVLGDSAESPRFIETIPRRGYRFITPVSGNDHAGVHVDSPQSSWQSSHRGVSLAVLLGLGAAAVFGAVLGFMPSDSWHRVFGKTATPQIRSIAVLPLQNLSADPAQEYFSEGMTDALITDLAQIGSVKVISRTSSMPYKQTNKSLLEIARELNVDGIVEGTVQRSGDRVRITAQLIQASSDRHLWASSYERDLRDVFALEQEVSEDITNQVRVRITTQDSPVSIQHRPVNLAALEAYLQGNYHLNRAGRGGEEDQELREAGQYFQRAIDAEPDFVAAYIGLAQAHENLWWPSNEDFELRRRAAEKAVELAPSSSDAWTELAISELEDWNWQEAENDCRRAIEQNGNSASAHSVLGGTLDTMGRFEEGWNEHQRAQELDPHQDHLSGFLYIRGSYDRSIELLRKTAQTRPDDGYIRWLLSQNLAQKGMYDEWVKELANALVLWGLPGAGRIRAAFASSGHTGALRQFAKELERLVATKEGYFPGTLAQTYAELGDKDHAFYWLRQACEHRHQGISDAVTQWVKVDPGFASLRSDPRFKNVLRCMGLPP